MCDSVLGFRVPGLTPFYPPTVVPIRMILKRIIDAHIQAKAYARVITFEIIFDVSPLLNAESTIHWYGSLKGAVTIMKAD